MDNALVYDKKAKKNKPVPIKNRFSLKDQDKANFNFPIIVNDGPGGTGVHLSALLVETAPEHINVKMFPISETASTYNDMTEKTPMLDVVLERGKPAKINSSQLVEAE